jgi:hypothetical protein
LPRSSRRPGAEPRPNSDTRPAGGVPQGAPYRPPAAPPTASGDSSAVSDAEFRPVPPAPRSGGPGASAPRDNSSRFDD